MKMRLSLSSHGRMLSKISQYDPLTILVVFLLSSAFAVLLTACNTNLPNLQDGQDKVLEFRQKIREGRYDQVYSTASQAFRSMVEKEGFIKSLGSFSEEIGDSKHFVLRNWKTGLDLKNGKMLVLTYEARDSKSIRSEEYMFVEEEGDLRLFNYRIDLN